MTRLAILAALTLASCAPQWWPDAGHDERRVWHDMFGDPQP
jgi:hypothetical protein